MALPDLTGRTAVVTGASRGIGAVLAREFHSRGMNLGLCSRSAPEIPSGETVLASRFDVRDEVSTDAFTDELEKRFGKIDLWINNAGVLDPVKPVRDIDTAEFGEHIAINLTGVFIGTRSYIQHVRRRGEGGVLINISSGAAWSGYAGWSAYCAGKAGVDRLTECVALEEAESGLRAHAVAPGVIDTDMQARIRSCTAEQFPAVERFIEMKRDESFNSAEYVARELLAIAFDPDRKTDEVTLRLEDERG